MSKPLVFGISGVYPNGTIVSSKIKGGFEKGIIKSFTVTGKFTVTYKVGYFIGHEYKEIFCDHGELDFGKMESTTIGYGQKTGEIMYKEPINDKEK